MYTNNSKDDKYPKTLLIRNTFGGMIWQVYHVNNEMEVEGLSQNATVNGFDAISLEDYSPEYKETWKGWRCEASSDVVGPDYVPTEEDIRLHNERIAENKHLH